MTHENESLDRLLPERLSQRADSEQIVVHSERVDVVLDTLMEA